MTNIAVVGEGPIGLLTVALLLPYTRTKNPIKITWYHKYTKYTRRHIINISSSTVNAIQDTIHNCNKCISRNDSEETSMSIRLLETILLQSIQTTQKTMCTHDSCNIYIAKKFIDTDYKKFDHVFLTNGYASPERKTLICGNKEYTYLMCTIHKPILVLYGNLGPVEPNEGDNIQDLDHNAVKIKLSDDLLSKYNLTMSMVATLTSVIYRTRKWFDDFPKIKGRKLSSIDLWVNGYENFVSFMQIFNETLSYLHEGLVSDAFDMNTIFEKYNVAIDEDGKKFIQAIKDNKYQKIISSYYTFVRKSLNKIKGLEKPFMIHVVIPNSTCFGLLMDKGVHYSNKINNTRIWLLGDSANAYPPGSSLEIGLKNVLTLIPMFVQWMIYNNAQNIAYTMYLSCNSDSEVVNKTANHSKLLLCKELTWRGGYPKGDERNNVNMSLYKILDTVSSLNTSCSDNHPFITFYNMYMINNFLDNVKRILCEHSK